MEFLKEVFRIILHDVLIVSPFVIMWYLECWRPKKKQTVMNIFCDLINVVDKDNILLNNIIAGEDG
jgi:hypothetical protein